MNCNTTQQLKGKNVIGILNNMDESQMHYTKWKSYTKMATCSMILLKWYFEKGSVTRIEISHWLEEELTRGHSGEKKSYYM
jgi:hypothetical protein